MIGIGIEILTSYSEALAVVGFALYIAYEIRLGVINSVQESQRVIGVGLYRVIKRDESLDEEAFRRALWGDDDEAVLYRDLSTNGDRPCEDPEDYQTKPGD